MKTTSFLSNLKKTFKHRTIFFPALTLLFSLGAGSVHGQKVSIGASLSNIISGNGLGASISPQLSLNTTRHNLSLGVNIQDHHGNFTGFRGNYQLILNPSERFDIFLFYDIASHHSAFLGRYAAYMEGQMSPESAGYFDNVKINTIEQHAGFGISVPLFGPLNLFWAAGIGHYTTQSYDPNHAFKYRDNSNCSVILMAGLKMDLVKIRKPAVEPDDL